jgi:hypothetical protein
MNPTKTMIRPILPGMALYEMDAASSRTKAARYTKVTTLKIIVFMPGLPERH